MGKYFRKMISLPTCAWYLQTTVNLFDGRFNCTRANLRKYFQLWGSHSWGVVDACGDTDRSTALDAVESLQITLWSRPLCLARAGYELELADWGHHPPSPDFPSNQTNPKSLDALTLVRFESADSKSRHVHHPNTSAQQLMVERSPIRPKQHCPQTRQLVPILDVDAPLCTVSKLMLLLWLKPIAPYPHLSWLPSPLHSHSDHQTSDAAPVVVASWHSPWSR